MLHRAAELGIESEPGFDLAEIVQGCAVIAAAEMLAQAFQAGAAQRSAEVNGHGTGQNDLSTSRRGGQRGWCQAVVFGD